MTDYRKFGDLELGHLGSLLYLPAEKPENGPGLLQTTRLTPNTLRFEIIGSSAELYPPSKHDSRHYSSHLWRERQVQQRWLLNTHPEASMGNEFYPALLKEDMERFAKADEAVQRRPLLAFGLMTDVREVARKGMSLLAVATGLSGETLRLTRVDETQWQWGEHADAALHLSVIESGHQEDEATWTPDAVPILQIKTAIWTSQFDAIRWLLVQKSTSTTILQPECRQSLTSATGEPDPAGNHQLSFISANPLLTLKHHQTGGNAHSDVGFKPPALGQHPQLIVLDECGYWSIWNILGVWKVNKKTLRLSQYKCGHMSGGLLESIPQSITTNAERHGLLRVGKSQIKEGEADRQEADPESTEDPGSKECQSQYILMWNSMECRVADVEYNVYLPTPDLLSNPKRTTDEILDIQRSCLNEDHVFVLTSRRLIWLDLFGRQTAQDSPGKPKTVLSCTHFGFGHGDMRMSVTRASHQDPNTSLVFTYSCTSGQLCVYWFTLAPGTGLPQWHRHITQIPGADGSGAAAKIRQLRVEPAKLDLLEERPGEGPGSTYYQGDVDFYQVSILKEDYSVRYCICASRFDPKLEITLPSVRMGWSKNKRRQRWRKTRKHLRRHKKDIFVLSDELSDLDLESALESSALEETDVEDHPPPQPREEAAQEPRPVLVNMARISRAINKQMNPTSVKREPADQSELFTSIRKLMAMGLDAGSLPLTTWQDVAMGLRFAAVDDLEGIDLEVESEKLFDMCDDLMCVTRLRRHEPADAINPALGLSILERRMSVLWLEKTADKFPEELQRLRSRFVSEIALDLVLSSFAVMVQSVPLLGPDGFPSQTEQDIRSSVTASQSSSFVPRIAVSSPSEPPSSAPSLPSSPDGAFERLKLLCPSIEPGKLGAVKQSKLLQYWPTERHVDTRDYVSSVMIAAEEKFSGAKERLKKKEAKRRAHAERFKRPAFMRQGFPTSDGPVSSQNQAVLPIRPTAATQIMSSQQVMPESSQVQGPWVTMSQPVAGAFGDRKKGKKGKRKSGFR